jgi:hypothetical protein
MNMSDDERVVRETWEYVHTYVEYAASCEKDQFHIMIRAQQSGVWLDFNYQNQLQEDDTPEGRAKAWSVARQFTDERKREIAELRGQVDLLSTVIFRLRGEINCNHAGKAAIEKELALWIGIYRRLQTILAEKTRGMKAEAVA